MLNAPSSDEGNIPPLAADEFSLTRSTIDPTQAVDFRETTVENGLFSMANVACTIRVYFFAMFACGLAPTVSAEESSNRQPMSSRRNMKEESESLDRTLKKLFDGLKSPDSKQRISSLRLLRGAHSRQAVQPITALLSIEADWMVRYEAVRALRSNGGQELVPTLLHLARKDPHHFVRIEAIRAISQVSSSSDVSHLATFLNDGDMLVRLVAAGELAGLGNDSGYQLALAQIGHPDSLVRKFAIDALKSAGKIEALPVLRERLEQHEKQVGVLDHLVEAIRHIELLQEPRAEWPKLLRAGLADADRRVRDWATFELRAQGDADAKAILREAAENPKHPGQIQAYQSLGQLDGE